MSQKTSKEKIEELKRELEEEKQKAQQETEVQESQEEEESQEESPDLERISKEVMLLRDPGQFHRALLGRINQSQDILIDFGQKLLSKFDEQNKILKEISEKMGKK